MVECESCSYWSHSKCVNLSTTLASSYPFVCPFCVKSLFSELAKLRSEVSDLRTQVSSLSSHVTQSISLSTELERVGESLAQLTSSMEVLKSIKSGSSDVSTADGIVHPTPVSPRQSLLPHIRSESHESRRGNLVISGIPECPQGTRKAERLVQDQASVAAVLSLVSPSVTSQSIRDLFRLGKYKADRHRPILVKLHKYWDASIILSNKQRLSSSPEISIRPDLSPTQMVTLSLLVKKQRELLSSGRNSSDIKIKGNKIYVQGNLFGEAVNGSFVGSSNVSLSDATDSPSNTGSSSVSPSAVDSSPQSPAGSPSVSYPVANPPFQ